VDLPRGRGAVGGGGEDHREEKDDVVKKETLRRRSTGSHPLAIAQRGPLEYSPVYFSFSAFRCCQKPETAYDVFLGFSSFIGTNFWIFQKPIVTKTETIMANCYASTARWRIFTPILYAFTDSQQFSMGRIVRVGLLFCSAASSERSHWPPPAATSHMEVTQALADALRSCGARRALSCARALHGRLVAVGLASTVFLQNTLLHAYLSCGALSDARRHHPPQRHHPQCHAEWVC
jgi:hypothetical protein